MRFKSNILKAHSFILIVFFFLSCKEEVKILAKKPINKVAIQTILQDTLLNVRALEVFKNGVVAASSVGDFYILKNNESTFQKLTFPNQNSLLDSMVTNNFRAIAVVPSATNTEAFNFFGITIASPAKLFKNGKLVYQENHEKAFYDSMTFWNSNEGIAIGDPTENCMSILITRDGGDTWQKIPCSLLPQTQDGEAAFAASDTNLAIIGNETWIATGGKSSRVMYSPEKGKSWQIYNTPIIQGLETTGMYSIDFYDKLNGFAIGGDYTKASDSSANKIRTQDGGKTWDLVAKNQNPGYRSCVQYFPNSNAKQLVAVGFKGIDYSNDAGNTWNHLSDTGFYTIRFVNDSIAYAAGKGSISKLIFSE